MLTQTIGRLTKVSLVVLLVIGEAAGNNLGC